MSKHIISEEFKRMQKLAGLINENISSAQDKINTILSNANPELDTFIQPVKFMIDQSFSEDVDINIIWEEAKAEMEYQLERANDNKDLRLIFAKIEAILS
jgi:hypothetical protein